MAKVIDASVFPCPNALHGVVLFVSHKRRHNATWVHGEILDDALATLPAATHLVLAKGPRTGSAS